MRISTYAAYEQGLSAMQQLQSALDRTQRQIASGQRILTPSDDPISSSRAIALREKLARLDQFDRNSAIANNRLQTEEAALSNVNNVLQRVRELALQANNSTQSNESRKQIAVECEFDPEDTNLLGHHLAHAVTGRMKTAAGWIHVAA